MHKTNFWGSHRWSGWPGAYCMLCGMDDPIEAEIENFPIPLDMDNPTPNEEAAIRLYHESIDVPKCPKNPDDLDPYLIQP